MRQSTGQRHKLQTARRAAAHPSTGCWWVAHRRHLQQRCEVIRQAGCQQDFLQAGKHITGLGPPAAAAAAAAGQTTRLPPPPAPPLLLPSAAGRQGAIPRCAWASQEPCGRGGQLQERGAIHGQCCVHNGRPQHAAHTIKSECCHNPHTSSSMQPSYSFSRENRMLSSLLSPAGADRRVQFTCTISHSTSCHQRDL